MQLGLGDAHVAVPLDGAAERLEELGGARGVGGGGGGSNYCPADPVSREQMGVFISVTFGLALYGP